MYNISIYYCVITLTFKFCGLEMHQITAFIEFIMAKDL